MPRVLSTLPAQPGAVLRRAAVHPSLGSGLRLAPGAFRLPRMSGAIRGFLRL